MRVTREEGFSLIKKFISEATLLECNIRLQIFESRFRGRLRDVTASGEIKFLSDDGASALSLIMLDSMEFGYTEGTAAGPLAAERFEGILVVILRSGTEGSSTPTISFGEVRE